MATCSRELDALIQKATASGGVVVVRYDLKAWRDEGRRIVLDIQISGIPGFGPFPMSALTAAERLRSLP